MRLITTSLVVLSFTLTACANRTNHSPRPSISDEEKAAIEKPINCSTAKKDIAILEDEKASVGRQALAGVRSLVPFSAAAGILMGDYRDRVKVATGTYNDDLEAKIQQIKATCGVS
jgi:hypothetical protein